jgi:transposase-like protein
MNKSELSTLEKQLAMLPHMQKTHLLNLLTNLVESQTTSFIENESDVACCRHCACSSIKKWGKSAGLQRYKCKNTECAKTFNALTGTALSGLRQKDKWFDYLQCMFDSLPLRKAAQRVNIDLTTAFRWRHRFLNAPTKIQTKKVSGIVEADETFFLESFKGKRAIEHRKPRKRGGEGNKTDKEDKISVLIVRDRNGQVCDFVLDELNKEQIQGHLKPIVDSDAVLCTDGASWYKTFAKQENIAHRRLITLDKQRVMGKAFHIQNVNNYISRLKTWIARFNGVGTDYLANYLGWRRLFETSEISTCAWLKIAMSINNN